MAPMHVELAPIELPDLPDHQFHFFIFAVEMRSDADARSRPVIHQHVAFGEIDGDSFPVWNVENHRASTFVRIARAVQAEAGFRLNSPRNADERGGTVILDIPDGKRITVDLAKRDMLVDYRPGAGIRIAPHFYSKDEEMELVIGEIRKLNGR